MVLQWESNRGVIQIKECHCILCLVEFYNSFFFHYSVCFESQCNVMEFNHEDWLVLFVVQGQSCLWSIRTAKYKQQQNNICQESKVQIAKVSYI
jgi:hypothetical protein